jgi:hypothetical protein
MKRIAIAALAVVLATCSSSKVAPTTSATTARQNTTSTTAPPPTTTTTSTTVAITTTTVPPTTTTTVPLESVFQSLVERYDAATEAILADPRVANDPSNPLIQAYLALFPKDSKFALGGVKNWVDEGNKGRFYKPGPAGKMTISKFVKVVSSTDTEARFTYCAYESMAVFDINGNPLEASGGVIPVEAVAVNVDGVWLFRDLTQVASSTQCPRPGTQ